jgi:hypothetical protein
MRLPWPKQRLGPTARRGAVREALAPQRAAGQPQRYARN